MNIQNKINEYISSLPEPKRSDLQKLREIIQNQLPGCKLWFLDGKNEEGKTVSNPNIGFGNQNLPLAKGQSRPFYQIGISANTTGISLYILGKKDKKFLSDTFGPRIGKASVSGYCLKFKSLKNINTEVLAEVVRYGAALEEKENVEMS